MSAPIFDDDLVSVDASSVTDPADHRTFAAVFARTYDHNDDPASVVDTYREYQTLRSEYPDAGSHKLANKLGVPRSTIRKWVDDGAVPYVVQGLETADERGWIPMDWESTEFGAMNQLVAWVMSAGSIQPDRWSVRFVVDGDDDRSALEDTLDQLGLSITEAENPGTKVRGTVVFPTPDGSVLGRLLHCLGAPRGGKAHQSNHHVPPYLENAPNRRRREWLDTYLNNRQRTRDAGESWITFKEDRPEEYHREFVDLVADVTGASASVSDGDVYISTDAASALTLAAKRYHQIDTGGEPLPLVDEASLAATFPDPEEKLHILDQYRRFEAADGYYTNVAREENIPASRAASWHNGSTPVIQKVVGPAETNGWLATEWTPTTTALADLVMGIHAGGSVSETFVPNWHVSDDREERIRAALETVGVGSKPQGSGVRPASNSAALGRALAAAGAPTSDGRNRDQLPDWVYLVGPDRREEWLQTIVSQRASQFKERSPTAMIRLDWSQSYLTDLAVLIETVTGVDAHIHDGWVTVPADAVRKLGLA